MTALSVAPADRIAAIDILRGIALFGVMAINVVNEFRVSIFAQFIAVEASGTWLDRTLQQLLNVGISLKALALFSVLFGVGLAIQHERLAGVSRRTTLLLRRLGFLMAVGAVHLVLIWNGDILLEYALAGLVVVPFLFASTRVLTGAGLGLLVVFVAAPFLPPMVSLPDSALLAQHAAEATRVYGSGDFAEVLAFRVRELPALLPLHAMIFPRTVALMLIGAALWRSNVLRPGVGARPRLGVSAAIGIALGGILLVALANGWLRLGWRADQSAEHLGTVLLAGGYGAAILAACSMSNFRPLLSWAAPVGRMAFTNYLMQSMIFGWIFYGYGLGLFGRCGVAAALGIGTAVYVLQVLLSAHWLKHYRHGPVEWLWRWAMLGRRPPFRSGTATGGDVGAT